MRTSLSGLSRVQVQWERLVRKSSPAHAHLGGFRPPFNLDRLVRLSPPRDACWSREAWRSRVASTDRLPPPLAGSAWLSCLSTLSLACAAGDARALREALDGDQILLSDGSSSRRVDACLRGLRHQESLAGGNPRSAQHAFAESIAVGHQALDKPLLPWLEQACAAYLASSPAILPGDWPPRQGCAHGLRSMIELLGRNAFFMRQLFRIPSAVYLRRAHQEKIIDGLGLQSFAVFCAKSAPLDPDLFSHILSKGLDALGPKSLSPSGHSRVMVYGSVWRRDLPSSIEMGLDSWAHSAHARSNPHASVERAAHLLAQVLASRGVDPHHGEDAQRPMSSPGSFRQALDSSLEARALSLCSPLAARAPRAPPGGEQPSDNPRADGSAMPRKVRRI